MSLAFGTKVHKRNTITNRMRELQIHPPCEQDISLKQREVSAPVKYSMRHVHMAFWGYISMRSIENRSAERDIAIPPGYIAFKICAPNFQSCNGCCVGGPTEEKPSTDHP